MPKKRKSSKMKSTEYWDGSNWLWEGLDSDDELLIAYNRRPSEDSKLDDFNYCYYYD